MLMTAARIVSSSLFSKFVIRKIQLQPPKLITMSSLELVAVVPIVATLFSMADTIRKWCTESETNRRADRLEPRTDGRSTLEREAILAALAEHQRSVEAQFRTGATEFGSAFTTGDGKYLLPLAL